MREFENVFNNVLFLYFTIMLVIYLNHFYLLNIE